MIGKYIFWAIIIVYYAAFALVYLLGKLEDRKIRRMTPKQQYHYHRYFRFTY